MEPGDPDQNYFPRPNLHDETLREQADVFANTLMHDDTLQALVELAGLTPEEKGEVIRLGLAQLREQRRAQQDVGNAEHLLQEAEFATRRRRQIRPIGRGALFTTVSRAS